MIASYTEGEIQEWRTKIDGMSQVEMARLWRFAPSGHPVFRTDLPLHEHFKARFREKGGMAPAVSKSIGW